MESDETEGVADSDVLAERLRSALEQIEGNAAASEQARGLLRQATSRFMDEQSTALREFREEMAAAFDAFREEQRQKLDDLEAKQRVLSERQRTGADRLTRELAEMRGSFGGGDAHL